jgi:hypothetical protein
LILSISVDSNSVAVRSSIVSYRWMNFSRLGL